MRYPKPTDTTIELFRANPGFKDARNYLAHALKALGKPSPTRIQDDMMWHLQHGPEKLVIEGFRGAAKTWITAIYVTWCLGWDQSLNILIVSGSQGFAIDVSTFILQLIEYTVPGLKELSPAGRERHSKVNFDVARAPSNKDASVSSLGITSQLQGHRGDLVISDDVETTNNSLTPGGRDQITLQTREFGNIAKPGARIVMLGTPQTEQSIYNQMPERGYEVVVWPIQYPTQRQRDALGGRLSPMLAADLDEGRAEPGDPTDPLRFPSSEIAIRRAEAGPSGFALQYMLDTSLSDVGRYPLRLSDLAIMDCPVDVGPERVVHSIAPNNVRTDLVPVGMNGDKFYGGILPEKVQWFPWQGTAMFIDPSGTGSDETAYAIGKHLHGLIYCPEATGIEGGYSDATMSYLAEAAKRHKVNRIVVESNFGDGMFEKLLLPHLLRVKWPCGIEGLKVTKQKELRILDTLEPVMAQHRLVVAPAVFQQDAHRSGVLSMETAPKYLLAYQMTRLTRERGSLRHDDRVDALAGMVGLFLDSMSRDVDRSAVASKNAAWEKHLEEFCAHATGTKPTAKTWIHQPRGVNEHRSTIR